MASCTCGHTEARHPNGPCLDCPTGKCRKYVKSANATTVKSANATTVKAKALRDQDLEPLPDARVPTPKLSSVKGALSPEEAHGEILSAANGFKEATLLMPPAMPPLPTDGPDGSPFVLTLRAAWKPERLDFYLRGDICFNLGHLGEYLAISAIGEVFWRGQRIGRNAELRRRVVSWLGNAHADDQVPMAPHDGGLNLNSSHGLLPFRPGCKRGAPGKILFVGADGEQVMSIGVDGFYIGDKAVSPSTIVNALMEFFDDAEPTGNGVSKAAPSS
jgi:hypothetical protein